MTRCEEFYEKWKRDPNWCDKCDTEVRRINKYIETLDAHPSLKDVSATALRPILERKLDVDTRQKLLEKVEAEVKLGKPVTSSDVVNLMTDFPKGKFPDEKIPETPKEAQIEEPLPTQPDSQVKVIEGTCVHCGKPTPLGKLVEGNIVCPGCYDYEVLLRRPVIRSLVECSRCHMASRETTEYKGSDLCPRCLEDALYRPDRKPVPPAPVVASILKPMDTWEQRKAQMQVPVSKMETAVLIKLEGKGLHPESQKEFCLRSTRPDYYFQEQNCCIFLDGEIHKGREDRDEALRELLSRRYGVRVVTILYEGSSEATEDSIVQQILEAIMT